MRNFQAFWANPWWLWGIWSSSQISIGPWAATTPRKEGSWRHTLKVCLGVPKVDRWWVGYGSRVNSQETPQHWLSIYIPTSTELFILGMREEGRGYRSFDPFASICYCIGPIVWAALGTVAELCTEMQVETGSLSSQLFALLLRPKESMLARDFLFPHFSHDPPPSVCESFTSLGILWSWGPKGQLWRVCI